MKSLYLLIFISFCLAACKDIEDAPALERNTFIRFFEKGDQYTGQVADIDDDGFIVAGNVQTTDLKTAIVVTKTDALGNIIWEETIENASVSSIKTVSDGYLIFGDSIEVDPTAQSINDITKTKAQLLKMNKESHQIIDRVTIKSRSDNTKDFHGYAVNVDASNNIVVVGSINTPTQSTQFFVAGINATSLDTLWTRKKELIDRDYDNSKSVYFTTSGKVIWASSAVKTQQNSVRAYLTIPVVQPQSDFVNSSYFGENEDNYYSAADIKETPIGFGIIGTYSTPSRDKANMYFVRANQNGTIIQGSEKFFDGVHSEDNSILTDKGISESEDSGDALTATSDGGFLLAGSSLTTTSRGNGGKDVFLVRIDAFGNILWNKIIGGAGDETVSSVKTTTDGGFLICGSSAINGLSSAYIIKTDRNGDIKN